MGDAAEGLIDADARIQERMEELERERRSVQGGKARDPELTREHESLRLARVEMQRQFELTSHDGRRHQLTQAMAELDKRLVVASARLK